MALRGQMMEQPLLISSLIDYAAAQYGDVEIVSRSVEGPIHRTTYADAHRRSRQLAQAPTAIDALPAIVDAVGDRAEVILDGGIRRGADIVKALALGANACMIGRAYLYGLAAAGEPGVDHALGILRDETRRTMALLGATSVDQIAASVIRPRQLD